MNAKKTRKKSAQRGASLVGSGTLVRRDRVTLPPGWEKCRIAIKGVRKWRNMTTQCWVTDRADDPDTLHCGVMGVPSKRPRYLYTAQQAINCITSEVADYMERISLPNKVISTNPQP